MGGGFPSYPIEIIEDLNDWLENAKLKLGKEYLKDIFLFQLGASLAKVDSYLKQRIYRHQRNNEFLNSLLNSKDVLKQHYQTLGLTIHATIQEVKKQYRKLAQKFHPDLGGDAEQMKSINQAYEAILATSG